MRACVLSVIVWISLQLLMLPAPALAQTQGAATGQTSRPDPQQEPVNPLLQGIIEHFIDEMAQPDQPDTRPPDNDSSSQDDVQVTDRQGPVIRPRQAIFTSDKGSARVIADITDPSGVARAVASSDAGRVAMAGAGGRAYAATVRLASHYRPVRVGLQAWDRRGNASAITPVAIRRVPACGSWDDVSVNAVKSVQSSLNALGLLAGGVDGLAGPGTCGAIKQAGITGVFSWPAIARELELRVAISLIRLEIAAPNPPTADLTRVRVRVVDPGNTAAVTWMQMHINGAQASRQQNTGDDLIFRVDTPEGSTRELTFTALPRQGREPLATRTISLKRPEPLRLFLSGDDLAGNLLESDEAATSLMARLEGASFARVFFENRTNGQRGVIEFFGTPIEMPVVMPGPGQRGEVIYWAEEGNRTTPRRRVTLQRITLPGPDLTVLDLAPLPPPEADTVPTLVLTSTSPGYGTGPTRLTELVADAVPGPVPPPPPPPRPDLPAWLAPAAIGGAIVFAIFSAITWLFRRGFRRQGAKAPTIPPTVHVTAHPDKSPVIEVTGGDLPDLVLTVDCGAGPVTIVEFEQELERAAR